MPPNRAAPADRAGRCIPPFRRIVARRAAKEKLVLGEATLDRSTPTVHVLARRVTHAQLLRFRRKGSGDPVGSGRRRGAAGDRLDRPVSADAGGEPRRRALSRRTGADPRRGPGDRVLQPPLYRGRRHLHDRDGDDRRRCRHAGTGALHHRHGRRPHHHAALQRSARAPSLSDARLQAGQRLLVGAGGLPRPDRGDHRPRRRRSGTHQRRRRPHQPGCLRPPPRPGARGPRALRADRGDRRAGRPGGKGP